MTNSPSPLLAAHLLPQTTTRRAAVALQAAIHRALAQDVMAGNMSRQPAPMPQPPPMDGVSHTTTAVAPIVRIVPR